MEMSDQVCSVEQAKKLKEIGVKLKSIFYWSENIKPEPIEKIKLNNFWDGNHGLREDSEYFNFYPAYTVAELGVLLPGYIYFQLESHFFSYSWVGCPRTYSIHVGSVMTFYGQSEAELRADCLIWLIENQFVNPKELKL